MSKPTIVKGRCWVIKDASGAPISDIDTDMIFHNAYLAITELEKMGQYAFGNLEGWQDFAKKAKPGDIIIAGANFGAGSSRQQAVDCFRALGISALIAESFGAIYFRNAVNSGFPVIIAKNIMQTGVESGETISVNFETGEIINVAKNELLLKAKPFSQVQLDIYQAGSLFDVKPR